jgi:hypothetical protein
MGKDNNGGWYVDMGGSNVDVGSCGYVWWAPVWEESSVYSLKLFFPRGIEAARASGGRLGRVSFGLQSDDLAMLVGSKVGDLIAGGLRVEM